MAKVQPLGRQLFRIAAGDQIEQRTPVGQAIQRRCTARRQRRGDDARRSATKNFSRWVTGISEAATSGESSHERPVGISTPPNPSRSAARAICCK